MTTAELDQLVAQIGDEILARLKGGAGAVCPVCQQGVIRQTVPPAIVAPMGVPSDIASLIDHTLLKPEATEAEIQKLCAEAAAYGFASVCVNPYWVSLASRLLRGAKAKVCTVVGFPLGATHTESKVRETELALRCGAQEIDMVQNVGALRSGDATRVALDIAAVVRVAHGAGAIVKVILETALLDDAQKVLACKLAQKAGADFVKTSTGFGPGGAKVEDIALMRATVGPAMGVKASGGIRTLDDLKKMVGAGATRIGASAGIAIVEGAMTTGAAGGVASTTGY